MQLDLCLQTTLCGGCAWVWLLKREASIVIVQIKVAVSSTISMALVKFYSPLII